MFRLGIQGNYFCRPNTNCLNRVQSTRKILLDTMPSMRIDKSILLGTKHNSMTSLRMFYREINILRIFSSNLKHLCTQQDMFEGMSCSFSTKSKVDCIRCRFRRNIHMTCMETCKISMWAARNQNIALKDRTLCISEDSDLSIPVDRRYMRWSSSISYMEICTLRKCRIKNRQSICWGINWRRRSSKGSNSGSSQEWMS